jgi:hypothetical protein
MRAKLIFPILAAGIVSLVSCKGEKSNNTFEWQFGDKQEIVYKFNQITNETEELRGVAISQLVKGEANLEVNTKSDSMADINLANLVVIAKITARDTSTTDTFNVPDLQIPNMSKSGVFVDGTTHILYRILFPLPGSELAINESVTQHYDLPINISGSQFQCKGYLKLTRKENEQYNERDCAVLQSEFNLSDLQIPPSTADRYIYKFFGSGTYYFDQSAGQFLAADINSSQEIKFESKLNEENPKNKDTYGSSEHHYTLQPAD